MKSVVLGLLYFQLPADPVYRMRIHSVKQRCQDEDDSQAEDKALDLGHGKFSIVGKKYQSIQEGHGGHSDNDRNTEYILTLLAQLLHKERRRGSKLL